MNMKRFFSIDDIANLDAFIQEAIQIKNTPLQKSELGKGKTLGLVFLNSSLRTRLSTQKAAHILKTRFPEVVRYQRNDDESKTMQIISVVECVVIIFQHPFPEFG